MSFRRYLVASGIVALGCAGAMPFYQPNGGARVAARTESPDAALPILESDTDRRALSTRGEEAVGAVDSARVSLGHPKSPGRPTGSSDVPPRMAATFDDAVGSRLRWAAREAPVQPAVAGRVESLSVTPRASSRSDAVGLRSGSTVPADRIHVVQDGDSLERLARRYYGSERYAAFLYSVNRAVLRSPQLLPIGVSLRIPARPPALSSIPSHNGDVASKTAHGPRLEDPDGLVPVVWQ